MTPDTENSVCPACDGKGLDPACREETCMVCGGSGQVVAAAPSTLPSAPAAAPGVPAQHWKERHEKVAEWANAVSSNKLHPINMAHMVHALYYCAPTGGEAEQLQTELDARRYRWMRDDASQVLCRELFGVDVRIIDSGADLDARIDAAMGVHLAASKSVRTSGEALGTVPSAEQALRKGVRQIVQCLREKEWADSLTTDPDLADLEAEVGKLVGMR